MLNSFFINTCILVALVASLYHIFRAGSDLIKRYPLLTKIFIGLVGGFTGYMLMINTMQIEPTIIVDFRNIPIVLSAIFGGPVSGILAAAIIALERFDITNYSPTAFVAGISIFSLAVCSSIAAKYFSNFRDRWFACYCINILISVSSLYFVLTKNPDVIKILLAYFIGTTIMTLFLYILIQFYLDFNSGYVKLTTESSKDFLTGLNNVRAFDIEFNKAISHCSRKSEHLAYLAIDIDFFKKINDTYGHASGDLVLKQFADLLLETSRVFDIVSRNGGEEFSIILLDCPLGHAFEVAERIRRAVELTPFKMSNGVDVHITVSIGITSFPESTDNPEYLIEYADKALYNAKRSGRNKVVIYKENA